MKRTGCEEASGSLWMELFKVRGLLFMFFSSNFSCYCIRPYSYVPVLVLHQKRFPFLCNRQFPDKQNNWGQIEIIKFNANTILMNLQKLSSSFHQCLSFTLFLFLFFRHLLSFFYVFLITSFVICFLLCFYLHLLLSFFYYLFKSYQKFIHFCFPLIFFQFIGFL